MKKIKTLIDSYFHDMNSNQIPQNSKKISIEEFEILGDLSQIQNSQKDNGLFTDSQIKKQILQINGQQIQNSDEKIIMEYENDFSDFILVYDKPQQQQILKKEDWDQIIMQNSLNGFRYKDIHYSLLKGIKYSTRKDIWLVLADVKSLKDEYQVNFQDLTKITSKDAGQIKKDVLRTYVEYKECNAEEFQKYLYQILNAYAILDPELGYAQGMNFIVAALLIHLDPNINSSVSEDTYIIEDKFIENSFWILVHIMKKKKIDGFFSNGMPKIFEAMEKLKNIMIDQIPHIYKHITENQLNITTLFCQYFFTIMLYNCPKEFGKRILDLFLFQGEEMIYGVIINMCKFCEEEIMQQNDIESFMKFFRVGILQRCHEKYLQQEVQQDNITESILNTKPDNVDKYIFSTHNKSQSQI